MKLILLTASLFLISCANTATTAKTENTPEANRFVSSHQTHYPHTHSHGTNCGHETITEGMDTFYMHDGHKHKIHAGHIDDVQ